MSQHPTSRPTQPGGFGDQGPWRPGGTVPGSNPAYPDLSPAGLGLADDAVRRRRMINLVAVIIAAVLVVTAAVAVVITVVTGPSHRDRAIASINLDEAAAASILPTADDIGTILDVKAADQSYVGASTDLEGIVTASVNPSSCLPALIMGPSPLFETGVEGWTYVDSKLVGLSVQGIGFANRTTARASFEEFIATLGACPKVSYRTTSGQSEVSASYTVTSTLAHADIPCVEWQAELTFDADSTAYVRTQAYRVYLLGNAVFVASYYADKGARTPTWAAPFLSDVERRLQTLIPAS